MIKRYGKKVWNACAMIVLFGFIFVFVSIVFDTHRHAKYLTNLLANHPGQAQLCADYVD